MVVISRMGSTAPSTGRTSPDCSSTGPLKTYQSASGTRVPAQNPEESHSGIPTSLKNHSHMGFIVLSDVTICTVFSLANATSRFLMKNFLCLHFPKTSCRNVEMQMSVCSTKLKGGMVAAGFKKERNNLYTRYKKHEA